jgi:uncharacterized protein (DUF488 family)
MWGFVDTRDLAIQELSKIEMEGTAMVMLGKEYGWQACYLKVISSWLKEHGLSQRRIRRDNISGWVQLSNCSKYEKQASNPVSQFTNKGKRITAV